MTTRQMIELTEARRLLRSGEARRIRVAAGLSQPEIARTIGVSPSAISRWETGSRRPTGEPALAFAELLTSLRKADK